MRQPVLLTLAFVLGCAAGFGVSHLRAFDPPAGGAAAPIAAAPSPDQVGARAREILTGNDPVRRITELSALLPTLGPEAVPALIEAFDAAPLDGGDPELVLLGLWWSRFDPEAARKWTTSDWRARFGAVIAAVFRGWAHRDPQQALAATGGVPFPVQRELAVDAVLAGWDESGRPGLEERSQGMRQLDQQRFGETLARRRVVSLGPAGAIRWAESLEDPAFREIMGVRVAGAVAAVKGGGPVAAAWAEPQIASAERPTGYPRRIGIRWIVHDPAGAMAWLASLPAGDDRDDGVEESFRTWLMQDRTAAAAWAEQTELQRWNEPAMVVHARSLARERPLEAVALAGRFSDESLRDSTLIAVGRSWTAVDREAAAAWFEQAPGLSEHVRKSAQATPRSTPRREKMKAEAEAAATLAN